MEEYFKTLPQENGECSFDPWDAFCKTGLDIFGTCVRFDLMKKYNPDLLRAAMQWENHARGLYEGTWVDMGGGEYAELPNIESREKRLNLLSLAYGELNRFEGSVEEDWERAKMVEEKRTWIITKRARELELLNSTASGMGDYGGIGLARGIEAVKNLLEWYHTDAEFVAPLVNGKTLAIPCGNGWGQQGEQLPDDLNASTGREQNAEILSKDNKPKRERGRPKKQFKDIMINDPDGTKLSRIHSVIDGKRGKDVALIILACIMKGWTQKPTYRQVRDEFGDIGAYQGFNKYLTEKCFTDAEIKGAKASLD